MSGVRRPHTTLHAYRKGRCSRAEHRPPQHQAGCVALLLPGMARTPIISKICGAIWSASSDRVADIPGEKLVIPPITLNAHSVRGDQDTMPVPLALCIFAVEFHIGLAVFGPF